MTTVTVGTSTVTVSVNNSAATVTIPSSSVTVSTQTGSRSFSGLLDVLLTSITDGDIIVWDVATSKFVNLSLSQAGALPLAGGTMDAAAQIGFTDEVNFLSGDAGGATGLGFLFDTTNSMLSAAGGILFDVRNVGVSQFNIFRKSASVTQIKSPATSCDFGSNTSVTNGFTFGSVNTNSGASSIVVGQNNSNTQSYSAVFGFQNTGLGAGIFSAGLNNTSNGSYDVSIGLSNNVTGFASVGIGTTNIISTGFYNSAAIGSGNNLSGTSGSSYVLGLSNTVPASTSVVVGQNNTTGTSILNTLLGSYITTAANGQTGIGRNFIFDAAAIGSVLIGRGLNSTLRCSLAAANTLGICMGGTDPSMLMHDAGGAGLYSLTEFVGRMQFDDTCTFQADAHLIFDSTTGNKIGSASTEKLAFWGATPIVQPAANADTSGATLTQLETEVNKLKQLLRNVGLMAT